MSTSKRFIIIMISSILAVVMGLVVGLSGLWYTFGRGAGEVAGLTVEQMSIPYWFNKAGNEITVYNEIVTPIRYGTSSNAVGYLTYTPSEIISVKNYSLETTYSSNQYSISGNQISFPYDNGLPYLQDEWLDGKNVPAQYQSEITLAQSYKDGGGTNGGNFVICEGSMTRTNFLVVTYKYNSAEQDLGFEIPTFCPENYPNLLKKLNASQPIKMLVFGDSISTGASASGVMGFAPYTPTFFDQIKTFLANKYYGGDLTKISLINASLGGTASIWGVQQVVNKEFDLENYDLIILGFGMNDGSALENEYMFKTNMVNILTELKVASPNADFILLGTFTPNPDTTYLGNHESYMPLLQEIAEDYNFISDEYKVKSGCTFVNLWDISNGILDKKKANNTNDTRYQYMDISANYVNHPNDFMVRLYAGAILSTFIEF